MYQATTRHITVRVTPSYLSDQSDPSGGHWVFAYQVEIENGSRETVQLRARRWLITDARGRVEVVEGPGVVGEEPILEPGDSFTYTSGCPLTTSSGIMRGHYRMQSIDGTLFEVEIPAFSLDAPADRRVLN
ncbi:Co2+/Mg2+ efflux protein ApaG [Aureimonas sp. AU22]|uniref:Co2+/Mg2+ efflux protein ApaG n=1 Tax=Aureimonas sp. AU22 TaxID=1638162 RepID=UPI0007810BFC|nr:Co2+/Mg2+ efflux protein ApaG [Aureimonas sp. AU22]